MWIFGTPSKHQKTSRFSPHSLQTQEGNFHILVMAEDTVSYRVVTVEAFDVKNKDLKHFLPDKLSNRTGTGSLLTSPSGQKTKEEPELDRGDHLKSLLLRP